MIRTQVQFSEAELARLKGAAAARGVSLAEMVRRAVDLLVTQEHAVSRETLRARALAACGRFGSGRTDGSVNHDEHLDEAYRS